MIRQTDQACRKQTGQTMIELVMAMTAATLLMAGLSSALLISTRAFDGSTQAHNRSKAAEIQADLLNDLQQATEFTTRTATSVTFKAPDRDGDAIDETISYDWDSGTAELNYIYNGSPPQTLLTGVNSFALSYLSRSLTGSAPAPPPLEPNSWGERWFVGVLNFGYETQFPDERTQRRKQVGTRATLIENGTVESITAYFTISTNSDIRYAIYDTDGSNDPDNLIVESGFLNIAASGWHTINIPPTYLVAGEYYLCLAHKSNAAQFHTENAAGGETHILNSNPVGNPSSNWTPTWSGADNTFAARVSIYASYTPE